MRLIIYGKLLLNIVDRRILMVSKWDAYPLELRPFQTTPALETLLNTEKYLSSRSDEDTRAEIRFRLARI